MDKEKLKDLVLDARNDGYIVFEDIEGVQRCKLENFVKQPLEGQLYDINRDWATLLTFLGEQTWLNNAACVVLLEYYHNMCKELKEKLKVYEQQEAERPEEGR